MVMVMVRKDEKNENKKDNKKINFIIRKSIITKRISGISK